MLTRGLYTLVVLLGGCLPSVPPPDNGSISGIVVASAPVAHATLMVWQLDVNGHLVDVPPFAGTSNAKGRFHVDIGEVEGPLLLTVQAGETTEYWQSGEVIRLDDKIHLAAVLDSHFPGQTQLVAITPFTAVAAALASARFKNGGKESTYAGAVITARKLLGDHLDGIDVLARIPASAGAYATDEQSRYGLVLEGLSALASVTARRTASSALAWNTISLTQALVEDASDHDALMDGQGPNGPVFLGGCSGESCLLSPTALRVELARAIVGEVLPAYAGEQDAEDEPAAPRLADIRIFMTRLATRASPELFPELSSDRPQEPIDNQAPVVTILSSPAFDESFDRIDFTGGLVPVHIHREGAEIDLADAFETDFCPRVYKHVNQLHDGSGNPLRWNVEAFDRLGDLPEDAVSYRVGIRQAIGYVRWLNEWHPAELAGTATGRRQRYTITLTSDQLAELAQVEGTFELAVRAGDREGNWSPTQVGCWEHVPWAPPLWVELVEDNGIRSLDNFGLNESNLVPLIHGVPEEQAAILRQYRVYNGTRDTAYLRIHYSPVTGLYEYSVRHSVAYVRSFPDDQNCTFDPDPGHARCILSGIDQFTEDRRGPLSVSPSLTSARLVDENGELVFPCADCSAGTFEIRSMRDYYLQVVLRDMLFLRAVTGSVDEVLIGPPQAEVSVSGVLKDSFIWCFKLQPELECLEYDWLLEFQALSYVYLSLDEGLLYGRTASTPWNQHRRPNAPYTKEHDTLFTPLPIHHEWTTTEPFWPAMAGPYDRDPLGDRQSFGGMR